MSYRSVVVCAIVACTSVPHLMAQSGTPTSSPPVSPPSYQSQGVNIQQTVPVQGSAMPASMASTTKSKTDVIGLDGYCPVCIIEMKKWVRGDHSIQATHDGKTYYFPGDEQKQMFLANPAKYIPALGGDCTVCLTEKGKRMPGSVHHSALSGGKLYLFPSIDQKKMFVSNPRKYIDAAVANGGDCAVCRVEMGKEVKGKAEFSAVHNGMTYWFPGAEQRSMFLANPSKYTK